MCLSKIIEQNPKQKEGIAYKYIRQVDSDGYLFRDLYRGLRNRKINFWYKARERRIWSSYGGSYLTGFHIYKTKYAAKGKSLSGCGVVVKVEYKDAHTIGIQDGCRVIVAKRMKIIGRMF